MAIFIEVVAANGRPPESPQRVEFAEAGGSIGRAEDNVLKLPDPQRHISRYHARVTHRLSRYFILDTGSSTPVVLNSVPIGNGREAEIRPGDELRIGHYLLHVTAPADAGSTQFARDALSTGNLEFTSRTSPSPVAKPHDASPPTVMGTTPTATFQGSSSGAATAMPFPKSSPGAAAAAPNAPKQAAADSAAREATKRAEAGPPKPGSPGEAPEAGGKGLTPATATASNALMKSAAPAPTAASERNASDAARLQASGPTMPVPMYESDAGKTRGAQEPPLDLSPLEGSSIAGSLDPRAIVAAMKGEIATGLKHTGPPSTAGTQGQSAPRAVDIDVGSAISRSAGARQADQDARVKPQHGPAPGADQEAGSRFQRFKPPPTFILDEATEQPVVDVGAPSEAVPELAAEQIDRAGSSIVRALYDGAGIRYPAAMQDLTEEQAYALGGLVRVIAFGLREILSGEALPASGNPIAAAASVEAAISYLLGIERGMNPDPRIAVREAFDCIGAAQRALPAAVRGALRIVETDFHKTLQAELARSLPPEDGAPPSSSHNTTK